MAHFLTYPLSQGVYVLHLRCKSVLLLEVAGGRLKGVRAHSSAQCEWEHTFHTSDDEIHLAHFTGKWRRRAECAGSASVWSRTCPSCWAVDLCYVNELDVMAVIKGTCSWKKERIWSGCIFVCVGWGVGVGLWNSGVRFFCLLYVFTLKVAFVLELHAHV